MKEYIERAAVIDLITRRYELPELCTHEINSIPAADVVEVRHGRWEMAPYNGVYDIRCSSCGYCPGIRFYSSNYCPNCGARMTDEAVEMVMERIKKMEETGNGLG